MVDFLSPAERSERMSRIKSINTGPELMLRKVLHRLGLRYRLNVRKLPGKPDLTFPRFKTVILVHGCFWHRHQGCNIASTPKSNTAFWTGKFDANVIRDKRVKSELSAMGWRVLIVWECELASVKKAEEAGKRIYRLIKSVDPTG